MNMNTCNSALDMIGDTPVVQIRNFDTGPCQLFIKLEYQNPSGSLKDRSALSMIDSAEKEGKIKPGDTLVEATSGNTALALAFVGNLRGYKSLIVATEKISQEKLACIKAYGAEVVITRSDYTREHPEYYHNLARRLAQERKNAFYIEQFANPANPLAYELSLAPEIWRQMGQRLDAVVCGIGTGGHMTGIGRFMKKVAPHVQMILADPVGSILAPYVNDGIMTKKGRWLIEGIGEDAIHPTCEIDLLSEAFSITDIDAFATAHELLKKESIFVGPSSGAAVCAALRYCRKQTEPKRVITFAYDSGVKYLSKTYNNEWLSQHGIPLTVGCGT